MLHTLHIMMLSGEKLHKHKSYEYYGIPIYLLALYSLFKLYDPTVAYLDMSTFYTTIVYMASGTLVEYKVGKPELAVHHLLALITAFYMFPSKIFFMLNIAELTGIFRIIKVMLTGTRYETKANAVYAFSLGPLRFPIVYPLVVWCMDSANPLVPKITSLTILAMNVYWWKLIWKKVQQFLKRKEN